VHARAGNEAGHLRGPAAGPDQPLVGVRATPARLTCTSAKGTTTSRPREVTASCRNNPRLGRRRPTRSNTAAGAGPVRRAKLALEQLAGRVPRQVLDEVDGTRFLVARQTLLARRDELFPADVHSLSQLDERLHRLAPLV